MTMVPNTDGNPRQILYDTANTVVDEWIGSNPPKQFTLFDVTRECRRLLGRSIRAPHYGVEGLHDVVLGLVNDKIGDPIMGWNRVLIEPLNLKPGEDKPQLYYHLSTDPSHYGIANPTVLVSHTQPDGLPAPDPQTIMGTTLVPAVKERRLCILKSLMDDLGLYPGDQVVVVADMINHCLIIRKYDPNVMGTVVKTYTVDLRGTIRVGGAVLDEVGLTGNVFIATKETGIGLVIR